MRYKDVIKDYKHVTDSINKLPDEHIRKICDKLDMDSFPVNIEPVSNEDIKVGNRIYAAEYDNDGGGKSWHIYRITHIRSGIVFFKRDNEKKEDFFDFGCIAREWMFPIKAIIYSTPKAKIAARCKCPLVKIVVK